MEYMTEIIIALIAFLGTLIGSFTANQKTLWRIEQLEAKVEKHNQLIERVTALEAKDAAQWDWIEAFKDGIEAKK